MRIPIMTAGAVAALFASTTASAGPTIKVHVTSDEPVAFEHRVIPSEPWELVCNAPCDADVLPGEQFRFAETADAGETKPFGLKSEKADANGVITIQHHKGNKPLYLAAPYVIAGSAALFIAGIVTTVIGVTKAHGFLADGSKEQTNAVTGVGTLMIMGGLAGGYFGVSSRINEKYSDATGDVRSLEPVAGQGQAAPQRGMAIFVPIFSGRF